MCADWSGVHDCPAARSPQPAARSPRLGAAMRTARPPSCTDVYRAQPAAARLNSALSATTSAPLLCSADTSGCPNLPPSALRAPSPAGGGRTRLSPAPAARARWPASRCRCVVEYQRAVALFGRYGGCPNLPHPPFGHLPPPAGKDAAQPCACRSRAMARQPMSLRRRVPARCCSVRPIRWMSELSPIRPSGTFPRRRGKDAAQPCACRSRAMARQPMSLRWKALLQWIGLRPA